MSSHALPPVPSAEPMARALRAAGEAAMARFRRHTVRRKPDGSEVTDADLAAEEALVACLEAAFPGDGIVSEEGTQVRPSEGHGTWWLDPIDGTSAFVEGLAWWGPAIGRRGGAGPALGGFLAPRTGDLFLAFEGAGAWRDGERLRPTIDPPAQRAVLLLPSGAHRMGPFAWPGKTRSFGATAAHLALVAAGSADATVIGRWAPWDIAGGIQLVREAGRVIADLSGAPFDPMEGRSVQFIAASPACLERVVGLLEALPRPLPRPGT